MATPSSAPGGLRRRNIDQATWSAPHQFSRSGANSIGRRDMAADSVDSSEWFTHIDDVIRQRSKELEQVRHDNANNVSLALMDRQMKQVRARSSPGITPMKDHVERVSCAFTSEGHSDRPPLAYPAAGVGGSTNSSRGSAVANSQTSYSWRGNERDEYGQDVRRHSSSVSTRLFHTPGDDVKSPAARPSSGSHGTNGYGQRGKLVNGRWSEGGDGELEKYKTERDALRAQVAELERRSQQHMQSLADERKAVHKLRQQLQAAENDASKERQQMRESMERNQRRTSELEAALQERRTSRDEELQAQLELLHQELARKDEELERLEERTNHYEACISEYQMHMRSAGDGRDAGVEHLQRELEAMSRRASELEGEIAEKERTVILQQEELEKLQSILSQQQRESAGGELGSGTTSEAAEGQNASHVADVADRQHEVSSLRAELSERDLRLQELVEQKRLEVEEVRRALEEATVELQRERQQWLQSVVEKDGRVVELGRDASGQKEELEAQVRALETKVEEQEEEVQTLTEQLHDTETQLKKDAESYSKMLSKVEQEYKQQINRLTGKMSVLGFRALERLRRVHSYEACIKKLVLAVMQMPTAYMPVQQYTTPVQVLPHPPAVSAGAPQPADPLPLAPAVPPLPAVQQQAFSPPPLAPTPPPPAPQHPQPHADLVGTPPAPQPLPVVPPVAAPKASGPQAAVLAGLKAMQEELQKMSHDNARLRWALARNWGCWLTSPLGTVFVAVAVAFLSQLYVMLNGSICRLDYYRSGPL